MNKPSPWVPMTHPKEIAALGKLIEELSECSAAASRCLIQGINELNPTTGEFNREWLEKEMADVVAQFNNVSLTFGLDEERMTKRTEAKYDYIRMWIRGIPYGS